MEVKEIDIDLIDVSKLNTRKDLSSGQEDSSIEELANSIKEQGLLSPITVMKKSDGRYEVIVGQRRFLACKKIGKDKISAIIRDKMDDTDATIISLIENVHRADMNGIDKAKAYKKIYEKYNDYEKVAKESGVSISTIKKYVALLDLAPSIQESITTDEGPAGIGTLSKLAETFKDVEDQEKVLDKIGGFKQGVQLEIIKRSGGDLDKIQDLRESALDGAFDTKICHGLEECSFIPAELKEKIMKEIDMFKEKESFKNTVKSLKKK